MMMTTTNWTEVIPAGLLLWSLKGAVWLTVVTVSALALRQASAATRSWVWTLGILGLLLLPLLSVGTPDWSVLPAIESGTVPVARDVVREPVAVMPAAGAHALEEGAQSRSADRAARSEGPVVDRAAARASGTGTADAGAVGEAFPERQASPTAVTPLRSEGSSATTFTPAAGGGAFPLAEFLMVAWLAGAVCLALPLLLATIAARRIRRTGWSPEPGPALEALTEGTRRLGIDRSVELLFSDGLRVPVTLGDRRPAIMLPAEAANWPVSRIRNVVLHELAHIVRHDWLTQMLGAVARCVHWFNPLVWLAYDRQQQEAECACDDLVLSTGSRPSDYAGDLVAVARTLRRSPQPELGLVAMARKAELNDRVEAILDEGRPRGWNAMRWVGGGSAVALALAIPLAALAPTAEAARADETTPIEEVAPVADAPGTMDMDAPTPAPMPPSDLSPLPAALGVQAQTDQANTAPVEARVLPGFRPSVAAVCSFDGSGRRSTSVNGDDRNYRIEWETDECSVRIRMEGRMTFAADDTRIESMEPGAYFELEERIRRDERRVVIEPRNGQIEYRYWVDREERPWDAEAQAWFQEFLPELFRNTTFNAEQRVQRMLREGGAEAVFDEVMLIESDHVMGHYLNILMEYQALSTDELGRIMDISGERMDSDHQLGEILMGIARNYGLPDELRTRFLRAATTLESDHTMGQVLSFVLDADDLSDEVLFEVLRAVEQIDSDHTASEVLMGVLRDRRLTAEQRAVFLTVSASIQSDHSLGQVFGAFLDQGDLTDAELSDVLDAAGTIDSDHTRGELLQRVMREYQLSGQALNAFLGAASEIDSDHTLSTTAMVVLEHGELTAEHIDLLLRMTETVDSDHTNTQMVLALIAKDSELADRQWDPILQLTERVDSDHSRGQIIGALLDSGELGDAQLLNVLALIAGTDSDHQAAEALVHLADTQSMSERVRERYIDVAGLIRSDHQRNRVLAVVVRGG